MVYSYLFCTSDILFEKLKSRLQHPYWCRSKWNEVTGTICNYHLDPRKRTKFMLMPKAASNLHVLQSNTAYQQKVLAFMRVQWSHVFVTGVSFLWCNACRDRTYSDFATFAIFVSKKADTDGRSLQSLWQLNKQFHIGGIVSKLNFENVILSHLKKPKFPETLVPYLVGSLMKN